MSTQPEALRLADYCDGNVLYQPAAAMLRAQHAALERKDALLRQALEALRCTDPNARNNAMRDIKQELAK